MKLAILPLLFLLAGCGHELLEEPSPLPQLEAVLAAPSPLPSVAPVFLTPPTTQPAPPPAPGPAGQWMGCDNPEYHPPPFRLVAVTELTPIVLRVLHIKAFLNDGGGEIGGGIIDPAVAPWEPLSYTRGATDQTVTFRWTYTMVIDASLTCVTERTIDIVVPGN